MSRRFDLSRPFLSNDCTNSVSAAGVVVFILIILRIRMSGGIRQRAHPQWLRRQNPHATNCAQGRGQSQVARASSQHGRSTQDTAPASK